MVEERHARRRTRSPTTATGPRSCPPDGGTTTQNIDRRPRPHDREAAVPRRPTPTGAYDAACYSYDLGRPADLGDRPGRQRLGLHVRPARPARADGRTPTPAPAAGRYDDAGQVVTATDSRAQTLHYTYDVLGRQTATRETSASGPLRAQWVYDTVAKGQLTSSTRYDGGRAVLQHRQFTRRPVPAAVDDPHRAHLHRERRAGRRLHRRVHLQGRRRHRTRCRCRASAVCRPRWSPTRTPTRACRTP